MSAAIDEMRASLTQAGDAQVTRVVAVVDALPSRGAADALIAPLRPRLAQLRPKRPPNFTRLLFTPLNPVIVPLAEWRTTGIGIPRSALAPIGRAVHAAMVQEDERWADAVLEPCRGPTLWPMAASILATMAMPADWPGQTGLTADDFATVAGATASVLHYAADVEHLVNRQLPPDDDTVRDIVFASRARGITAMETMVALLLARLPAPAATVVMLGGLPGGERAVRHALDRLVASLIVHAQAGTDMREVAWQTARIAVMVTTLETNASAERHEQLEQIRREAELHCRSSFGQAVEQTLALLIGATAAEVTDDTVATMEAAARDVRRLEAAGTRLGSPKPYETLRMTAVAQLRDQGGRLTRADQVRLVELLAGPEEALALLNAA